jgi:cell division septation protein DedD
MFNREFEVKLSMLLTLGLTSAFLLFVSYFLGFYLGRKNGELLALASTQVYLAKLPIAADNTKSVDMQNVAAEVYDKLSVEKKGKVAEKAKSGEDETTQLLLNNYDSPVKDFSPSTRDNFKNKFLAQGKLPLGWYVQVAAPKDIDSATEWLGRLKKSGFQALVETASVNKQKYYRIVVGPEKSKETVTRLVQQLSRERLVDKSPFLKQVK